MTAMRTETVLVRLTPDELERLTAKQKPQETLSAAIRRLLKVTA